MKISTVSLSILTALTFSASAYAETLPWGDGESGPYCREYTSTVRVGNRPERAHGVACMQPDGTWEIQPAEQSAAPSPLPPAPVVEYVPYPPPPPPFYSMGVGYGYGPHRHWRHPYGGSHVGISFGTYF